jgi:alpha-L-rhamnosidase
MNSFAHYSFGAVGEWMFKTIGGIDAVCSVPVRAAEETPHGVTTNTNIIIRPQPGGHLTWAKATYNSIHGPIAAAWRIMPGSQPNQEFRLYVTIPANTTATVYVPARDAAGITEGKRLAAQAPGVRFIKMQDSTAIFEVGSGAYHFVSQLP